MHEGTRRMRCHQATRMCSHIAWTWIVWLAVYITSHVPPHILYKSRYFLVNFSPIPPTPHILIYLGSLLFQEKNFSQDFGAGFWASSQFCFPLCGVSTCLSDYQALQALSMVVITLSTMVRAYWAWKSKRQVDTPQSWNQNLEEAQDPSLKLWKRYFPWKKLSHNFGAGSGAS